MQEIKAVTPHEAREWIAAGDAVLIDVREPEEFRSEHIASALSLPLSEVGNLTRLVTVPTGRKVIFQCLKGSRGQQACELLIRKEANEHPVFNLKGGIAAWKAEGLRLSGLPLLD